MLPKFRETRRVVISGEVDIPGTYFIDEKTKLSELIKKKRVVLQVKHTHWVEFLLERVCFDREFIKRKEL